MTPITLAQVRAVLKRAVKMDGNHPVIDDPMTGDTIYGMCVWAVALFLAAVALIWQPVLP